MACLTFDEEMNAEHSGETEVFWESQETVEPIDQDDCILVCGQCYRQWGTTYIDEPADTVVSATPAYAIHTADAAPSPTEWLVSAIWGNGTADPLRRIKAISPLEALLTHALQSFAGDNAAAFAAVETCLAEANISVWRVDGLVPVAPSQIGTPAQQSAQYAKLARALASAQASLTTPAGQGMASFGITRERLLSAKAELEAWRAASIAAWNQRKHAADRTRAITLENTLAKTSSQKGTRTDGG
jgi:hypothetical protein